MIKNDEESFQRIMAIDYLKSIAVILVILTHALSKELRLKIGGPFWISMAVPIFMILSGFTNSLSADKNQIETFKQFYSKKKLQAKLSRILRPYAVVICLELLLGGLQRFFFAKGPFLFFGIKDVLLYVLTGGTTPGSYYVLILLQFVFIFPLMLMFYRRTPKISITFFFSLHFFFDALTNYLPISGKLYRLLIFRYLAFIMLGIALYYEFDKVEKLVKRLAGLSFAYIGYYAYLGSAPKVFSKWANTSLPTVFWALALVVLGMTYLEKENTNKLSMLFSRIGQASYQIFLVQKFLFGFGLNRFFRKMNLNYGLSSFISIVLCCILGIVFQDIQLKLQRS